MVRLAVHRMMKITRYESRLMLKQWVIAASKALGQLYNLQPRKIAKGKNADELEAQSEIIPSMLVAQMLLMRSHGPKRSDAWSVHTDAPQASS